MKEKGFYIAFEGIDHSGKTTQYNLFVARLKREFPNREIVATREPGGTPVGEAIRKIVLNKGEIQMTPLTEAHLFAGSRSEGLRKVVLPALERNGIVVSDRCFAASFAYQGEGRGLGIEEIRALNEKAIAGVFPDKIVLCDVPAEVALGRRKEGKLDRIEKEKLDFHQRVREGYLTLAQQEPERYLVVDGTQSRETIQEIIWAQVAPLIPNDEIQREFKINKERE